MNAEARRPIADLSDLLVPTLPPIEDPERIIEAVENVHYPVVNGISALGRLLWVASKAGEGEAEGESFRETVGDIGCLLDTLGELVMCLNNMESNARYQQWQEEKRQKPRGRQLAGAI